MIRRILRLLTKGLFGPLIDYCGMQSVKHPEASGQWLLLIDWLKFGVEDGGGPIL